MPTWWCPWPLCAIPPPTTVKASHGPDKNPSDPPLLPPPKMSYTAPPGALPGSSTLEATGYDRYGQVRIILHRGVIKLPDLGTSILPAYRSERPLLIRWGNSRILLPTELGDISPSRTPLSQRTREVVTWTARSGLSV
jgi:hypothetical protein